MARETLAKSAASSGSWARMVTCAAYSPDLGEPVARLTWGPNDHRGELLDVVPGPHFGDRGRVGRPRLADQFADLLQVALVPWRGDQEQHAGRRGSAVGEGVRAAGWDEHGGARPAAHHPDTGGRLPAAPVARGPDLRLEGEQVEFAVQDIEQLLGVAVQMRADVEARCDLGLER